MKERKPRLIVTKPKVTVSTPGGSTVFAVQSAGTALVAITRNVRFPRGFVGKTVEVRRVSGNTGS